MVRLSPSHVEPSPSLYSYLCSFNFFFAFVFFCLTPVNFLCPRETTVAWRSGLRMRRNDVFFSFLPELRWFASQQENNEKQISHGITLMQSSSPLRGEVLSWYHTIVKSAFTVPWKSDEDAMYILSEARKLFRQNQFITDLDVIRRKIQEAEMRHTIAVHYLIPYPRPQHKGTGSMQTCGVVMRPDLDSLFDSNYNPRIGDPRTASTVLEMTGGAGNGENPVFKLEDAAELNDSDEGVTFQGSQIRPLTADRTPRR